MVGRLLATPQYGERWARPWLDVARYAEDQAHIVGNDRKLFYPNAYLYRDWVIAALNRDLPYDEFVKLQLAADLIEGNDSPNLAALGFIGLGPKYYGRGNPRVKAEEWEDRVDVVSRGLLGLTVACARCHDHKFDPIPTEDYYALAGVFASTEMFNRPLKGDADRTKQRSLKKRCTSSGMTSQPTCKSSSVGVSTTKVTSPNGISPASSLTMPCQRLHRRQWPKAAGQRRCVV